MKLTFSLDADKYWNILLQEHFATARNFDAMTARIFGTVEHFINKNKLVAGSCSIITVTIMSIWLLIIDDLMEITESVMY